MSPSLGDEYVAATGLPERRDDHYLVMIKFARDCMFKMTEIVRDLEESLGPGTQNLRMRFGIHSGAVTAGVLRGEKSRFQLFGDTGMQEIFAPTSTTQSSFRISQVLSIY